MKIEWVQDAFDRLRGKRRLKIYSPYYHEYRTILPDKPEIYNKQGKQMDVFFIRDRHQTINPYFWPSEYFIWDRFNYALDTHFYTGNALVETMGAPRNKYGLLIEPRIKQPQDYLLLEKNKGLAQDFTKILTYDAKLLESLPNALFFPGCASAWVSGVDADLYTKKTKMVSMLSSRKKMCPLHYLRIEVARQCKREGLADTFGTFDGGPFVDIAETLTDYRYTIAFENEISPYWFTERITSSFLSMTVPIYLGAERISDFFNPDGIIQIKMSEAQDIKNVLKQCSVHDYESRLPAILDNYQRAQKYLKMGDYLYESIQQK
jgi:Glycosyltransferase family 10 (fucosyltransferase) C-term